VLGKNGIEDEVTGPVADSVLKKVYQLELNIAGKADLHEDILSI
jgi:hypothetical protein